jgi:hypothetical protein
MHIYGYIYLVKVIARRINEEDFVIRNHDKYFEYVFAITVGSPRVQERDGKRRPSSAPIPNDDTFLKR